MNPLVHFLLSPFVLDRLRSIRTLLAVSKISLDAIAAERPFLPVPLLVFDHFCLASARQEILGLFPLSAYPTSGSDVRYDTPLHVLTHSGMRSQAHSIARPQTLGMLLWISFYIPIFPFLIHTWTSCLHYTNARRLLSIRSVSRLI